jgi:hypothetical protein
VHHLRNRDEYFLVLFFFLFRLPSDFGFHRLLSGVVALLRVLPIFPGNVSDVIFHAFFRPLCGHVGHNSAALLERGGRG